MEYDKGYHFYKNIVLKEAYGNRCSSIWEIKALLAWTSVSSKRNKFTQSPSCKKTTTGGWGERREGMGGADKGGNGKIKTHL